MSYKEQDLQQYKIRQETGVGVLQRTWPGAVQDKKENRCLVLHKEQDLQQYKMTKE